MLAYTWEVNEGLCILKNWHPCASVSYELTAYKQVLQLICLYKQIIKPLAQSHVIALGVRAYAAI